MTETPHQSHTAGASQLALLGGSPLRLKAFSAWPEFDGREETAIAEALGRGEWGGFPMPNHSAGRFEKAFATHHDARHGQLVANGTVSLEIALQALGVEPGAEVIVPAYTFEATAASVLFSGCVPVFADVRPEDYCICPDSVASLIGPKTQAIIPVHLAMNVADMDRLTALADRHGLAILEDCAHAHGARWRDRAVGSWGGAGSFSFQTSKLMTAGEGGIVITSDDLVRDRLFALTNCGRSRPGALDEPIVGHNYRLSDLQASILEVQLERLEGQHERRRTQAARFTTFLEDTAGLEPLETDKRVTRQAIYQYVFKFDSDLIRGVSRDTFVAALEAEGIPCDGRFYEDLTRSPLLARGTGRYPAWDAAPEPAPCPNASRAAYSEAVWIPHQVFLGTEHDTDDLISAIQKILSGTKELASVQIEAEARTHRPRIEFPD